MLYRDMTNLMSLVADLSDAALIARVKTMAERERQTTAELIALLAELDARRLYLGAGCSSLFTYCTQVLHLSEHAAYGRIEAARAARRFPVILERLTDKILTLTAVCLLAPLLTAVNHLDLLNAARYGSVMEVSARSLARTAAARSEDSSSSTTSSRSRRVERRRLVIFSSAATRTTRTKRSCSSVRLLCGKSRRRTARELGPDRVGMWMSLGEASCRRRAKAGAGGAGRTHTGSEPHGILSRVLHPITTDHNRSGPDCRTISGSVLGIVRHFIPKISADWPAIGPRRLRQVR